MELNFEVLEMQKLNIPKERAQRVNEKSGVICLVIMFTPRITVIKMSKAAHFFVSSADDSKKSVKVWGKYLSASERSYLPLLDNAMDFWVLSYHKKDANLYKYRISIFFCQLSRFFTSILNISRTVIPPKAIDNTIF